MDLTEDDQEVVGFEAVNEEQWLYPLESMLFVISLFLDISQNQLLHTSRTELNFMFNGLRSPKRRLGSFLDGTRKRHDINLVRYDENTTADAIMQLSRFEINSEMYRDRIKGRPKVA